MADYTKPDHWQLKARKEGYPARSVYKLKEMDEKFGLLKNPRTANAAASGHQFRILDLGAAPGSWSLYVLRKMASTGGKNTNSAAANSAFLCAADLAPLSRQYDQGLFDKDNFCFIQGDITEETTRRDICSHGPYQAIISDAAPATIGNRSIDAARSLELAEAVVSYADDALAAGGNLVIKVFQGGDTAQLLKRIRALFHGAKSFKPLACRSESFETYYVGLGKK